MFILIKIREIYFQGNNRYTHVKSHIPDVQVIIVSVCIYGYQGILFYSSVMWTTTKKIGRFLLYSKAIRNIIRLDIDLIRRWINIDINRYCTEIQMPDCFLLNIQRQSWCIFVSQLFLPNKYPITKIKPHLFKLSHFFKFFLHFTLFSSHMIWIFSLSSLSMILHHTIFVHTLFFAPLWNKFD